MIDLEGQVALVTGSSRGIGAACALRLAQAGADVVVNYVSSRSAAEEVAGRIVAMGRRAILVKADVSERDDVDQMAEQVAAAFGRIDILVSNAATGGFRPVVETTSRQFHAAMATNVEALIHLLRAFQGQLERRSGRAKVIALSSHGSRFALPMYGLVGMTKAALEGLVRQAALELGPRNVNVNALLSGLVDTDAVAMIPNREILFERRRSRELTGDRSLSVEDVADVALFLASPLADLVQGQTLVVDAGTAVTLG
ncbi:MAG: SDR family oxidoreductase [Deltaproteobacteria bacterium]|jgi:enoyl-[acyl-carrier protein] reductase III|nr:SDR family oxidoreductase [Deltaproteobacteria bacterium]